jgi:hypothetical protein
MSAIATTITVGRSWKASRKTSTRGGRRPIKEPRVYSENNNKLTSFVPFQQFSIYFPVKEKCPSKLGL